MIYISKDDVNLLVRYLNNYNWNSLKPKLDNDLNNKVLTHLNIDLDLMNEKLVTNVTLMEVKENA